MVTLDYCRWRTGNYYVKAGLKLAVLGNPSGIPLKITSNAVIRDNSDPVFFRLNADTYSGNSGSAVVDMKTGIVEGILVRGDTDYEKKDNSDCYTSVVRTESGGRGEDATRITNISFFFKLKTQ